MNMRAAGWVWEGQPAYRDFPPSMYGLGEGCEYFGLNKAYYLYHGNNAAALAKLSHLESVICDVSIWRYRKVEAPEGHIGWGITHDKAPETIPREAETVSKLSTQFPNVYGAMLDDLQGAIKAARYGPDDCRAIATALKSANPGLKLCATVYTHELDPAAWVGFIDCVDVVFLWTWHSAELANLDDNLARCRELFAPKPILIGCYLSDYTLQAPVPLDRLKSQWERIPAYLDRGHIQGYCILGAYLITWHPENARWVRDFIAAN